MISHFIFYVRDQEMSTCFYEKILELPPSLNVPGMTEFHLGDGCILGLMPEKGIKRLLGDSIEDPATARGIPRAELYLRVEDPIQYMDRAKTAGAKLLSKVGRRDWGDLAGYIADPDGHVVAFAKPRELG
jgi:catechol 2,3-dioxygenase-like lactoylglutathione lyase family enzyme